MGLVGFGNHRLTFGGFGSKVEGLVCYLEVQLGMF